MSHTNTSATVNNAKNAIMRAAAKNKFITSAQITDEMERADISGWLYLPLIAKCNLSEWTEVMSIAAADLKNLGRA